MRASVFLAYFLTTFFGAFAFAEEEVAVPDLKFVRQLAKGEHVWPLCPYKDGLCGYIDELGNWLIEPVFKKAGFFIDGMALVAIGKKYGFIGVSGRWAVAPKFESLTEFHDGLATALESKKGGYIDHSGNWVVPPQFDSNSYFFDGVAAASLGGKHGLIDRSGKWIAQPIFEGTSPSCEEGFCWAQHQGGKGFIDKSGKWLVEPKFGFLRDMSEGLATAAESMAGKHGVIDKNGKWVITPDKFQRIGLFHNGIAFAQPNIIARKHGYIDRTGAWAIEPKFDDDYGYRDFHEFKDGVASVKYNGKHGMIDEKGAWIVDPVWDDAYRSRESDALAWVRRAGEWRLLGKDKQTIGTFDADNVYRSNELVRLTKDNRQAYATISGKMVKDFPSARPSDIRSTEKSVKLPQVIPEIFSRLLSR